MRLKSDFCNFFATVSVWCDHFTFFDGLHGGPVPPEVHNQSLYLADVEGEVVYLAPHRQSAYLLPVCHLAVVGNQAYCCRVVSELDDES